MGSINSIQKLVEQLKPENIIVGKEISNISKIPFKVLSLKELVLFRTTDFCECIFILIKNNKFIPSFVLIRSIIENLAVLNYLSVIILKAINEKSIKEFDNEIMIQILGTRDDNENEYWSKNILTLLEKLDKRYSNFMKYYSILSEIAHPNHDGLLNVYSDWIDDGSILKIHNRVDLKTDITQFGLKVLKNCLEIHYDLSNEISSNLIDLIELCESPKNY